MAASVARADLSADVKRALAAIPKAEVGVQVVKLGANREDDKVLAASDADAKLIPASNLKIITTAAALEALGPDFRFRTRAAINASNDVAIIGDGDPTFGDREYIEKSGWTSTTVFENWAEQLKKNGITTVHDVLVDDSIFEETMFQPNWPRDQAHKEYVSQVAGVNFNANCLDVYVARTDAGQAGYRIEPSTKYVSIENKLSVGAPLSLYLSRELGGNKVILKGTVTGSGQTPFRVTIDDPAMFAATVFAETLEKQGVHVTGKVQRNRTIRAAIDPTATSEPTTPSTQPAWQLFAINETPLMPVMDRTNKESVNLYAESIGKRAAAEIYKKPGSWELVAQMQASLMKTVGAPADDYVFDDGCGLSKKNSVSAAAFCSTLAFMFHGPHREAFVETLAVSGTDGTLTNRFKGTKLVGRVFAKSGSVAGVRTLSGYVKTQGGEWFAFSVLINNIGDATAAHRVQDAVVKAIDDNAQ